MKSLKILIFLFLTAFSLSAQTNDKKAILKLLEDQRQAWNKGDLKEYMQGYLQSDSLLFVGESGPTYGWKGTFEKYKKGYPDKKSMGFLTFNIKEIRLIGRDNAFVLGAWNLKREKDSPGGFFTLLLEKAKGRWKVIVDHSS